MDILNKVRMIESTLARRVDGAARTLTRSGAREPLEIVHAIVDAVDREIQATGRGRRAFPFNSIHVSVAAPSREARERLQTVLAGDFGLERRIDDKLRSAACTTDPSVTISYVGRAQPHWREPEFHVKFANVDRPQPVANPPAPETARLDVTVLRGTAERRSYTFTTERIEMGRCVEVRDRAGRLVRTNDVAFVEASAEINHSVSRGHAHIARHPASGEFRLYDDGSAQGTHIVRQGKTTTVPRGGRGVRLQSGDEIVMGDARLRVRIT